MEIRITTIASCDWNEIFRSQPPPGIKEFLELLRDKHNVPQHITGELITKRTIEERFLNFCKAKGLSYELQPTESAEEKPWWSRRYSLVKVSK